MRSFPPLEVAPEDAYVLRGRAAGPESAASRRARIVLLAAQGLGPVAIAEQLGCSKRTAILWRERYRELGLAGLADAPRSGRPVSVDEAALIARTVQGPPRGIDASRWSTRSLGADLGISNVAVANVWRAWGIWPGRSGTVRMATRPLLEAPVVAPVGLLVTPVRRVAALLVGAAPPARPTGPPEIRARVDALVVDGASAAAPGSPAHPPQLPVRGRHVRLLVDGPGEDLPWARASGAGEPHVAEPEQWSRLLHVACAMAVRSPVGAAAVADLVVTLDAHPGRGPFCWTAPGPVATLWQQSR